MILHTQPKSCYYLLRGSSRQCTWCAHCYFFSYQISNKIVIAKRLPSWVCISHPTWNLSQVLKFTVSVISKNIIQAHLFSLKQGAIMLLSPYQTWAGKLGRRSCQKLIIYVSSLRELQPTTLLTLVKTVS